MTNDYCVCPVCEYPYAKPHSRMRDRFFEVSPEEFLLYSCENCGLLFQREEQVQGRITEFYPPGYWWEESEGNTSKLEKRYREWIVKQDQLKFVLSLFPQPQNYRLLDIGCGSGTFVKAAYQAGFDAFGCERSEEAVRIANRSLPGRIFHGSEDDLISRREKFDLLTLFHSLEHMQDPFRYLKNVRKLFHNGGGIIVQVPNRASFQAKVFGPRWYGLDCPRHLYNYTTFSLMHLLGRTGYRTHSLRHFSLRDNAAALVSSMFPWLDPMSQRVRLLKKKGTSRSLGLTIKEGLYLNLLILAQPFVLIEAFFGRGGTVTVYATSD